MDSVLWIFILLVLGAAAYTVIPDLFLHRLGIGSWKKHYNAGVALTFDDGPDWEITPKILDVLAQNNVQATFFVVGAQAVKFPELTQEILAQGHQIGLHSQNHRHAWFSSPRVTWREWEEANAVLEKITGRPVEWVRPPWGTFNLATWWWIKKHRKRIVLWNIEGHDWQAKQSAAEITKRIISKARNGGIVVLHDSGGEAGAPLHTLQALENICQGLVAKKKLALVPLEFPEWSGLRRLVFSLWQKWEQIFAKVNHLEIIDAANIYRLAKARYKGPGLYSGDGRILAKEGDVVGELHMDSLRLSGKGTDIHTIGIKVLRQVRESLPDLAAYINDNPAYADIQVFMGTSLLNRGVKGLGFNVQEVSPNWFNRGIEALQKLNLRIYHPSGKGNNRKLKEGRLKIVWISREELLGRWLKET
jgi:peptidoglycan/xylan/chitin deacetylase (PgdA/CDA1 family)